MRFNIESGRLAVRNILAVLVMGQAVCGAAVAQEEDSLTIDGVPVENAAVGRDLALRLRLEVEFSNDRQDLLDDDINYARFPSRVYSSEAKIFQTDMFNFSGNYSKWQNSQGLDYDQFTWRARVPLSGEEETVYDKFEASDASFINFSFTRRQDDNREDLVGSRDYFTGGYERSMANGLYWTATYRIGRTDGEIANHQLWEYVSYKVSDRMRVGEEGAVSKDVGIDDMGPWYAKLFAVVFLVPDKTSIRVEGRYSEAPASDLNYQEYNAYLYQLLNDNAYVRLNYRFYTDNADMHSSAWGFKVMRYFNERFALNFGYRLYTHSEGAELDTFYGGIEALL